MAARARLVLASASPRRLALLRQIGVEPDAVIAADVDESELPGELPRDYVLRVALAKAAVLRARETASLVLAADTAVACGRRILPKTEDETAARLCLELMSGRAHRVFSGVALAFMAIALVSATGVLLWKKWDWLAVAAFVTSVPQLVAWLDDS